MKKIATIRREIVRLQKMSEDMSLPVHTQREAYEAYHALQWVIEDVAWRPSRLIRAAAEAAEVRG